MSFPPRGKLLILNSIHAFFSLQLECSFGILPLKTQFRVIEDILPPILGSSPNKIRRNENIEVKLKCSEY